MKRHVRIRGLAALIGGLALLVTGASDLRAQRFQALFGSATVSDRGAGGAQIAANGDYVAVGTTWGPSGGASSDIYVVRTNSAGIRVWDRTFDINPGLDDVATDIHCCSNGEFVITGSTQTSPGGPSDIFVLRINAVGNMLWCHRYGHSLNNDIGYDIHEAASGNGTNTRGGDLLIAGTSYTGLLTGSDGYLLRIPFNGGAPIWAWTYDIANTQNYLYGIDESTVGVPAGQAGDVVAVGVDYVGGNGDVWVLRVDGNTGGIGAFPPQGSARYGGTGHEEGRRIQELKRGFPGDLVVTGRTNSNLTSDEILVLETQPAPGNPLRAAIHMGDGGRELDEGMALCEVTSNNLGIGHVGNILVTGRTDLGIYGSSDIFLQELAPGTLNLVTAGPQIFGGDSRDIGISVAQAANNAGGATPGYFIVGICGSPSIITPFDVEQVYAIKTDVNGESCRDVPSTFTTGRPLWTPVSLVTPKVAATVNTTWTAAVTTPNWGTQLCYLAKPVLPGTEERSTLTLCGDGSEAISRPSPMKRGGILQLRCAPAEPRTAQVQVSDVAGSIVFNGAHDFASGAAPMQIGTEGWPAGLYLVTITSGRSVERSTVVVVE